MFCFARLCQNGGFVFGQSSDARRITWESDAACQAELPALAGAEARAPAVPQPRPGRVKWIVVEHVRCIIVHTIA